MSDADETKPAATGKIAKKTPKETATPTSGGRQRYYKIAFGVLVLAFLLSFVLSRGNELITRPFIEDQLRQLAANISEEASYRGDTASLTYSDLDIQGGWFSKKAVISGLKIQYGLGLPFGGKETITVSTPKAVVTAEKITTPTTLLTFPEPFTLEREDYAPITATFNESPRYVVKQLANRSSEYRLQLPDRARLTVEATEEQPKAEVVISYAANPQIIRTIGQDDDSESTMQFKNIRMTSSAEKASITIAALTASSREAFAGETHKEFTNKITLEKLIYHSGGTDSLPHQVMLHLGGRFVPPLQSDADGIRSIDDIDINIHDLVIASEKFSIAAKGDLHRKPDEKRWFGHVGINVKGLDYLRNSGVVSEANLPLADLVARAVTGKDGRTAKEVSFSVDREKGGAYNIGNTTLERLLALVITHSLAGADAPKESPVEDVPLPNQHGNGVRAPLADEGEGVAEPMPAEVAPKVQVPTPSPIPTPATPTPATPAPAQAVPE